MKIITGFRGLLLLACRPPPQGKVSLIGTCISRVVLYGQVVFHCIYHELYIIKNVHLFFFTFRSGDKIAAPVLIYKPEKSVSTLNHKKPAFNQN